MPFSEAKAQHAIQFIEQLKHTKGRWAGQPFKLLSWEVELIRQTFGTLRDDGTRQYHTVYVEIPKKSGKSEVGAAIALYMLMADGEANAEVYSAACDRQQASIVFNTAVHFIEGHPVLRQITQVVASTKRIVFPGPRTAWSCSAWPHRAACLGRSWGEFYSVLKRVLPQVWCWC